MKVHVEQLDCTGSGQCELMLPDVFALRDDGLATTRTPAGEETPDGGAVEVPEAFQHQVHDAADICPGACIIVTDD